MPGKDIDNPGGAFPGTTSAAIQGAPGSPGQVYVDCYNSGSVAIKANDWVALDVGNTLAHYNGVVRGVHGATINQCIGIAMDAMAVGGTGRICLMGPVQGKAGAAGVVAGNLLSPSTVSTDDGELVAASSPTAGQVIGICLQTQATGGGLFFMWVFKV
jgi:hypothetical protein